MNGLCPDCGARLGAGDSVCRACGLPMPPGAVVTRARRAGAEVRSGAPGPIPASIPGPAPSLIPSSIPASIPSPKAGRIEFGDSPDPDRSVGGRPSRLGDIPTGNDSDAFDLSAILDAPAGEKTTVNNAGPTRPAFVPAFTFPGHDEEPADLASLENVAPEPSGQSFVPEPVGGSIDGGARGAGGDSWRVRNANQTVYDLASVDAVVQWLSNKEGFDGIRIARGSGPFRPVEDHPDLAARLGLRVGGASVANDPSPPRLDIEAMPRRPQGTRAPQAPPPKGGQRGAPAGQAQGRPPLRETSAKSPPAERVYGLGLTLVLATAGFALTVVLLVAVEAVGLGVEAPAAVVAGPVVAKAPPGPLLAAALQDAVAERYTAAEQMLQQAARSAEEKNDPRVYRTLAVALSKLGSRDAEARAALAEYRRLRARAGGN